MSEQVVHCLISPALPKGYYFLNGPDPLVVGREEGNAVRFNSRQVSRRHAVFEPIGAKWTVRDEGSTNGTLINGKETSDHSVVLADGDEIAFGPFYVVYRMAPDAETFKRWLHEVAEKEAGEDTLKIEGAMMLDETDEVLSETLNKVPKFIPDSESGMFGPGDIAMVLRHLERNRSTGELRVVATNMALVGSISLIGGVIVSARAGTFRNEQAVRALADLSSGQQNFSEREVSGEQEVALRPSLLF